ncbi:hypothetical protein ACVILH_006803 [Bradyrhizobium sp. USDA 4353]
MVTFGKQADDLAAVQRVDRAQPALGLAAHGADPERAGGMHARIVRPRRRIVGFEREVERQRAVGHGADVEPVLGDDQLPLGIDAAQRARHLSQDMAANLAAPDVGLEQQAFADIEPPGGVGRGVIGRPLAEMTVLGAEHLGRQLLHPHADAPVVEKRYTVWCL